MREGRELNSSSEYPPRLNIGDTTETEYEQWRQQSLKELHVLGREREHTEQDRILVSYLNTKGRELADHYGFSWTPVPIERIHYLQEESFAEFCRQTRQPENTTGVMLNTADLVIGDAPSLLWRASTMMHEMVHGEGALRLRLVPERYRKLFVRRSTLWRGEVRRVGLEMRGKETAHFTDLNEAITSMFADEALADVSRDRGAPAELREEVSQMERLRPWLRKQGFSPDITAVWDENLLQELERMSKEGVSPSETQSFIQAQEQKLGHWVLKGTSYLEHQVNYSRLLSYLMDTHQERFSTVADVHQMFVRATLKGEILPLARLIEETFGKGSLRELAEGRMVEGRIPGDKLQLPGGLSAFVQRHILTKEGRRDS